MYLDRGEQVCLARAHRDLVAAIQADGNFKRYTCSHVHWVLRRNPGGKPDVDNGSEEIGKRT
ncbi:MAG: hypothetical protein WCY11_11935 [Novosphingobium sp.]